ncbi:MAG: Sarcosine oxidase, gamma subunit family [Pseudomonadota bacterium]
MIDVTITPTPPAPIYALEIWGNAKAVATRFAKANGFALPPMGKSGGDESLTLICFEPTVWLAEGDVEGLADILGEDGALTAIGGGLVRVVITGSGWRRLLMEGGVFDAEHPAFAPGCSAATIIDHVNVRLHVSGESKCTAYVPASYVADMIDFWKTAAAGPY